MNTPKQEEGAGDASNGELWKGVVSAMRRAKQIPGEGGDQTLGGGDQIPGKGPNLVTSHFGIVLDLASSLMGMKR